MSVRTQIWLVPLWLMVLVGLGCDVGEQGAGRGYKIINTGIKDASEGCWYDDTRWVFLKGRQQLGTPEYHVEGLFYLEMNNPTRPVQVDLTSLAPEVREKITVLQCKQEAVVFYVPGMEPKTSRIYLLYLGHVPEPISEMRGGTVNLQGKYVLGKFRRDVPLPQDSLRGVGIYEAHPDCGATFINPQFRLICWDSWMEHTWVLPRYLFIDYRWYESIRVQGSDGNEGWVPNPEPPLKLANGTELKHGYLLRDMENRIIQQIPMEQEPYRMRAIHMVTNPQGEFLYTSCFKTGDHEPRYINSGRACRYKLDGNNNRWEEVFSPQTEPNDTYDLQGFDVNVLGDVVAVDMGHTLNVTLWKYTAATKTLTKVVAKQEKIAGPKLSPDGKTISFLYRGELYLAFAK